MTQLAASYGNTRLFSMADTYGHIQIVAMHDRVVCDIAGRNYDVSGQLHNEHAVVNLPLSAAIQLHRLLADAIVAAEEAVPTQACLWSGELQRLQRRAA
jgi:hypothetical protein